MHSSANIDRVALLHDPVRRRLYFYVRAAHHAVGRDEAAEAAGISRTLAAFHLDRLAEAGMLDVEFRRLSGKTGRGAGRPAKLYRPSTNPVRVSIPPTRYELAGELLLRAVQEKRAGETAERALRRVSAAQGRSLAEDLRSKRDHAAPMGRVRRVLADLGFEPESHSGVLYLGNCPFHELGASHPQLVCAMNHALIEGLAGSLSDGSLRSELEYPEGFCCVVVRQADKKTTRSRATKKPLQKRS